MKYQDLKVLYEDNHIIVVIKPAGIPCQNDKSNDVSMLDLVKEYIKVKANKKGEAYVGLVHRLDRMVGGIMVFAKTSKGASRLSNYIRERNFKKEYVCICKNINNKKYRLNEWIELKNYLYKNEKLNKSFVAENKDKNKDVKEAVLEYCILKIQDDLLAVKVKLHTGRHHQIRVQLSNIGLPILYDAKYGKEVKGKDIMLFSSYLSFYHPTKDEIMEYSIMPSEILKEEKWKLLR